MLYWASAWPCSAGGGQIPLGGNCKVLDNAETKIKIDAHFVLGPGVAKFCCQQHPIGGNVIVCWDPIAGLVHQCQVILSVWVPLRGRLPIPIGCLGVVFLHPQSIEVQAGQKVLGQGKALKRGFEI